LGLVSFFFFSKLTWLLIYWMIEIVVMELFSFLFPISMEGADNNDGLCAQGLFFFPLCHADTIFVFLILGVNTDWYLYFFLF
jgi:hypothetical protein